MNELLTAPMLAATTPSSVVHVIVALLARNTRTRAELEVDTGLSKTMVADGTKFLERWLMVDVIRGQGNQKRYTLIDDWHRQMQYSAWQIAREMRQYTQHVSGDFADVRRVKRAQLVAELRKQSAARADWLRPARRKAGGAT